MNDRELTYVTTIAEEGSISAAARRLYIAQPSLSQTLQRIEGNLGTKLFDRTPGGLKLTQAGKSYVAMARHVLKMYNDLKMELGDIDSLHGGTVVFGITRLLAKMLLPKVLPEFHRRYPEVKVRVLEGDSKELDRLLTACEISFAIMHRLPFGVSRHIQYDVYGADPFIVTVSADSPLVKLAVPCDAYPYPLIDIADLAEEPLLTVRYRQGIRRVTDGVFARAGIRPNIAIELSDYSTIQDLAACGMGYSLGPVSYTRVSRAQQLGACFLSLDESLDASWDLCIATFINGSQTRADQELKTCFANEINQMMQHPSGAKS